LSKLLTPEFVPEGDIATKRKLLDQATSRYIVERRGDEGGRVHYGQPIKLLTRIGDHELYFEPAHAKDSEHDALVDRLYPHFAQFRLHPGAALANFLIHAPESQARPGRRDLVYLRCCRELTSGSNAGALGGSVGNKAATGIGRCCGDLPV
jgi:hypothetical protein